MKTSPGQCTSLVLRGEVQNADIHQKVLRLQIICSLKSAEWRMRDREREGEPSLRMNKLSTPGILKLGRGEGEICNRDWEDLARRRRKTKRMAYREKHFKREDMISYWKAAKRVRWRPKVSSSCSSIEVPGDCRKDNGMSSWTTSLSSWAQSNWISQLPLKTGEDIGWNSGQENVSRSDNKPFSGLAAVFSHAIFQALSPFIWQLVPEASEVPGSAEPPEKQSLSLRVTEWTRVPSPLLPTPHHSEPWTEWEINLDWVKILKFGGYLLQQFALPDYRQGLYKTLIRSFPVGRRGKTLDCRETKMCVRQEKGNCTDYSWEAWEGREWGTGVAATCRCGIQDVRLRMGGRWACLFASENDKIWRRKSTVKREPG